MAFVKIKHSSQTLTQQLMLENTMNIILSFFSYIFFEASVILKFNQKKKKRIF